MPAASTVARAENRARLLLVDTLDGRTVEVQLFGDAPNTGGYRGRGGASYSWAVPVEPTGRELSGALLVAAPKAGGPLVEVEIPTASRVRQLAAVHGTVDVPGDALEPGDVIVGTVQLYGGLRDHDTLTGAVVERVGAPREVPHIDPRATRYRVAAPEVVDVRFASGVDHRFSPKAVVRVVRRAQAEAA